MDNSIFLNAMWFSEMVFCVLFAFAAFVALLFISVAAIARFSDQTNEEPDLKKVSEDILETLLKNSDMVNEFTIRVKNHPKTDLYGVVAKKYKDSFKG